jgi:hypothetical protein
MFLTVGVKNIPQSIKKTKRKLGDSSQALNFNSVCRDPAAPWESVDFA